MRARRGILSHPDFRRLWIADLLSKLGSRLLRTCETAAWLLLGLFAGAWVDRVRCLPVLVFADLGRAVLFASIPLAAAFGVLTLTQLYAVLALAGLLTVLFDVAHSSYPPRLLAPDQLLPGNAKLRSIRTPEPRPAPAERPDLRREIGEGLRYVFRHPLLRPITLNTATTMLFQSANMAVTIVFLVREIHVSPSTIGLLSMVGLLGALAASAFTERLSNRVGDARTLLLASIGIGVAFVIQALTGPGWRLTWYVLATLLAAICIIVSYILQVSIRQRVCPPELQGRVSATMSFVGWGAAPIGSLLGGLTATAFGIRFTLWLNSIAVPLGTAWLLFSPFRTLRTIPEPADAR